MRSKSDSSSGVGVRGGFVVSKSSGGGEYSSGSSSSSASSGITERERLDVREVFAAWPLERLLDNDEIKESRRGEGIRSKSISERRCTGREEDPTRWTLDVILCIPLARYVAGLYG